MLTTQTYAGLPYLVQAKLETFFTAGLLKRTELDAKCYIELRSLPEVVALEVLDKFCETTLSEIRNKTAFFLGIVKRFRNERGLPGSAPSGALSGAGIGAHAALQPCTHLAAVRRLQQLTSPPPRNAPALPPASPMQAAPTRAAATWRRGWSQLGP